jgi:putative hydrolase of the HAD superfamily
VSGRAVLLDAMGTLVRLEQPAPRLVEELRARHGIELSETEARKALGAEITHYRAHHDEGADAAGLARLRSQCAEVLREALPQHARAALPDRPGALTEALLSALRFSVYDDVRPTLGALRAAGWRAIVVSNWDVSLHDVLGGLGIAPLLDGVVTSAETRARKPDPAIFARGLALAGVTPGQAMHVGDSVDEDVAGARAAGIEPILVARHRAPRPAGVRVIRTLAELL